MPADSPAQVLDAAWQCFAMTFDHERQEITGWLDGKAGDRWQEDPKNDKMFSSRYNAWLQGRPHREPGTQPGGDPAFPEDQFYNPPEDKPISVKVLSETAAERVELQQFAYALQIGGPAVMAFEVGNEPDFYSRHDLRSTNYDYLQYRGEAEASQRAIRARSPNAPLAGPAITKFSNWLPGFVADFKGTLALATSHFYPLAAKSKDPRSPNFASVEHLLGAAAKTVWVPMIEEHLKASHAAGIAFRIGECNSASGGGTEGVSDVFASALWGADFLFDVAGRGVAGINFHGGFKDHGYTAFCFRNNHYHAHPLYYSMLLFHQAARGRVLPVDCQTPINVTAHAVLGDDRKLRVVLINKDLANSVAASIVPGSPCTKAEVIRLTAPSVTSAEGVTLAGSAVREDGTWTP